MEQPDQGHSSGNNFPGQTWVCAALQAPSSLVRIAKNPIDCTGCLLTEYRFIRSETSTQCTEATSVLPWPVCNTCYILGSSLPRLDFSFKQFLVCVFWGLAICGPIQTVQKEVAQQDTFII